MAQVDPNLKKQEGEDKNSTGQDNSQTPPSSVNIGGSAEGPSAGESQAKAYNPNSPTSSGRFTNLQSYLNANSGYNAQNGGLAGQIQSNLANQAGEIQKGVSGAQQQFQQGAEGGRTQYDQAAINAAIQDPNAYIQDQGNVDKFTKMRDATYNPYATNVDPYAAQAAKFQSTTNLAATEPGQYALLKNLYGTPKYGQGQQKLDQLLLQGNPQQAKTLTQIPTLGSKTVSGVNEALNAENALNAQYGTEAAKTQADTRAAIAGAVNPLVASIANQAGDQQSAYNKAIVDAQTQLAQRTLNPADLAKFGFTKSDFPDSYGGIPLFGMSQENLNRYFSPGAAQANAQNTLTQDQYNQFQALNKLAGNTLSGTDAGAALEPYLGASQVGQFAQNSPFTFDTKNFKSDVAARQNQYINDVTNAFKTIENQGLGSSGYLNLIGSPGASTTEIQNSIKSLQNYLNNYKGPDNSGISGGKSGVPGQVSSDINLLQGILSKYNVNPADVAAEHGGNPFAGMGSLSLYGQLANNGIQAVEPGTVGATPGATAKPPINSQNPTPILVKPTKPPTTGGGKTNEGGTRTPTTNYNFTPNDVTYNTPAPMPPPVAPSIPDLINTIAPKPSSSKPRTGTTLRRG